MDSVVGVYLLGLLVGVVGAVLFVLGIQPSLSSSGGAVSMHPVVVGAALMICAGLIGAIAATLRR